MISRSSAWTGLLLRRGARRVGIEHRLKGVFYGVQGAKVRRNRRDDQNLRVLIAASVPPDGTAIDVGANTGTVLEEIVAVAPQGHHVAYEPLPVLVDVLKERFPTVEVRQAALSDRNGVATYHLRSGDEGSSGLMPDDGAQPIQVRVERLDDTLGDLKPDLIKIDVEGAELQALEGMRETISRHRPVVAFEHGRRAVDCGVTHGMVFDSLTACGLRVFDMDGQGPFSRVEFGRVADPPGRRWNFFAR